MRASAFNFPKSFDDIVYGKQMTDFGEKEEGWQEWLHKYRLWDDKLTENQAYLRYLKFHKIKFQAVPEEKWYQYFWDLLPFEPALVFGDSIGLCEEFPFQFEVSDPTPLVMKPMPYAREQREFIRQHMEEQCLLGVMRQVIKGQEPDPVFVTNLVLVKDGQSQTDYRVCGNFVQPNSRIKPPAHPLIDCKSGLDGLQGCKIVSGMDIKAAFQNIWVPEELQKYLGIVTQDGLYVYTRMPFGINAAPAMFQHVITQLLDRPMEDVPRPCHSTYLDDVGVGRAEGVGSTWQDTLYTVKRLTWGGMPLNVWKCQFLVTHLTMLGMTLWDSNIVLGNKAMKKFLGGSIPKDLKGIQGLMGRLNFASSFIPDYRREVQPILNLMSKKSDNKWTREHTDCLNRLARLIHQRVRLGLCDMSKGARIHVDVTGTHCSGVMTQGEGEEYRVIAFMGRWLLPTEQKCCRMERLLIAAVWVLKRLGRYTHYLPDITIIFPHPAEVMITGKNDLPVRLQSQIIELTSYSCSFECGEGAWGLQNEVAKSQILEICDKSTDQDHPPPPLTVWEHQEITLQMPGNLVGQVEDIRGAYVMHYDGGCSKKEGTGGFIIWDPDGKCIGGGYKLYGKHKNTNNQAEAQALVDGLDWVTTNCPMPKKLILVARGDSNLITQFMQGGAKPGNKLLVESVKQAKLLNKECKKVHYQHVPREKNQWADWLTRVARHKQKGGDIIAPDKVQAEPPDDLQADLVNMVMEGGQGQDRCAVCGTWVLQPGPNCWGCERKYHKSCLSKQPGGGGIPTRPGPWHCRVCVIAHQLKGTRDITLDEPLLQYLAVQQKPEHPKELDRVIRASHHLRMDEQGSIKVMIKGGPDKTVPAMKSRMGIITNVGASLAFPNGKRLYELLRNSYFWEGMQADCLAVCASMLPRQIEGAKFKSPPYLFPTEKGAGPFRIWCVDSIGPLQPKAPDGADHIIVAVDPFTKWVEAGTVPVKNSFETALWFHKEIVCRYGLPSVVRTDRGTEYSGVFDGYMHGHGIIHRRIATMNPRANGQVERMVAVIKSGIRRVTTNVPGSRWWENLPDVLRGQRCLQSRATGYSPHLLVFKTPPVLPLANALLSMEEEDIEDLGEGIEQISQYWEQVYQDVVSRQLQYDEKMKKQYLARENLAKHDVRFIFNAGEPVLLKQRVPGKMQCKASGPFVFDKYIGPLQVNAIILDRKAKPMRVSAGNLLPMSQQGQNRLDRYEVPGEEELNQKINSNRFTRVQDVLQNLTAKQDDSQQPSRVQDPLEFEATEQMASEELDQGGVGSSQCEQYTDKECVGGFPKGMVIMSNHHLKRYKRLQQQDFVKKVRAGPSAFDSTSSDLS